MRARSVLLLACVWAGCSFPTDGVLLQAGPDADLVDAAPPDADTSCDPSSAACDGPDLDLCPDDTFVCDADGNEICGNTSGDDDAELCNGLNDDCDGEIDEDFDLGKPCDGVDGDECDEGMTVCSTDGLDIVCDDATDTIAEACNMADDDCDGVPDDGFDLDTDIDNCGVCGNQCTNDHSTTSCSGSKCQPVCDNGYASCDADPDDGCETLIDTDPTCSLIAAVGADVNGDVTETVVLNGTTEAFFHIRMTESAFGSLDKAITGRLTLVSGAGTDFDLFVYCPAGCPPTAVGTGASTDVVDVGRDDQGGVDRSFDIIAEVRYDPTTPSTSCAQWTLTIVGDPTPAATNRCGN